MRNSGFFKLTGLVVAAALLLAVSGQPVFGQQADSGSGGASSDPQPANVLLEVTASAIDQLDLVDKGSATPDFAALAADAAGEDGMPGDADGVRDWFAYTSDGETNPSLQWNEHDTNVNAYYRITDASIDQISVNVQGTAYTFTPNDWVFFKDDASNGVDSYYGPRTFQVTLATADATITEPGIVTATGEGSVTLRLLRNNSGTWSVATETISLAFVNGTNKLYVDDELNMDETSDTANGLTKTEDDTSAAPGGDSYAQGAFLVKGSEIEVRGIQYVLETDLVTLTDTGTVTFAVGQFSGYDQSQSSTSMGMEIAFLIPRLMPAGQALNFSLTVTGLEHANTH